MKKILIASSDAMMYQFLLKHARNLNRNGYTADMVCLKAHGYEGQDYIKRINGEKDEKSSFFVISATRNPLSLNNVRGYKQLKKIISENGYDMLWCNEPVMGVLSRLAARRFRKKGLKVMYMSHGFHFYKGAPAKNWLVFYTIEKFFAHFTDMLITVNRDDYEFAKRKMKFKEIRYIHGIGYDAKRKTEGEIDKTAKRAELKIPTDAFLVLSVGELNDNKNHKTVIKAISEIDKDDIYYLICGYGDKMEELKAYAKELGLEKRVIFAGFREDVADIYSAADLYCFPSLREGLSVSMLEAMSSSLPIVCSNIRGNRDLVKENEGGYLCNPKSYTEFAEKIKEIYDNAEKRAAFSAENLKNVVPYNEENSEKAVLEAVREAID